jgi:S1-C subfamily serine protease
MKRAIINIVVFSLVFVLTLAGCLGLRIPNKIIRTTEDVVIKKDNSLFPIESFVTTNQEFILTAGCVASKEQSCDPIVVATHHSLGSGFILETDGKEEYVMTAGHICIAPPPPGVGLHEIPGLNISYKISLTTGFGRTATAEIIAIDVNNDLCLLKASKELGPGLTIYKDDLMLHSKVYNMANPAGLASSLAVPVFEGYYIGDVSMLSLFTIPAVGGSSGSPIMNHRNEVVSIVSAAAVRFDEYAIGPKTETIRKFLLANIPKDP